MRSLRLVPYWSVHETLGVDAHNAPLKMRTRRIPPIPCGRLELRSSPPGRRCRTGQHGRGGERPPKPRAWYGRGALRVFTRCPRPPGVAPDPSVPRGKAIERRWRRCRTAISHQRTGRGARGAVPPPARCPGSGAGSWGFEGGRSIPSPDRNVQHCVGQEGRERERARGLRGGSGRSPPAPGHHARP